MATNWMVGGKGPARDGMGFSIRGWPRKSPAPHPPNGYLLDDRREGISQGWEEIIY